MIALSAAKFFVTLLETTSLKSNLAGTTAFDKLSIFLLVIDFIVSNISVM